MSYEDLVRRKRAERDTSYLEPHEMTMKELKAEYEKCMGVFHTLMRTAESQRFRAASIRARITTPFSAIAGGSNTTPRKKICRIHVWDSVTNTRIRGHKYDWRMPSYKGEKKEKFEHAPI